MARKLTKRQREAFTRINRELDRAINHLAAASDEAEKTDLNPLTEALAIMLRMGKLLGFIIGEIQEKEGKS